MGILSNINTLNDRENKFILDKFNDLALHEIEGDCVSSYATCFLNYHIKPELFKKLRDYNINTIKFSDLSTSTSDANYDWDLSGIKILCSSLEMCNFGERAPRNFKAECERCGIYNYEYKKIDFKKQPININTILLKYYKFSDFVPEHLYYIHTGIVLIKDMGFINNIEYNQTENFEYLSKLINIDQIKNYGRPRIICETRHMNSDYQYLCYPPHEYQYDYYIFDTLTNETELVQNVCKMDVPNKFGMSYMDI